ncbi:hypothetical protein, partial [Ectothiorhodospira shaposhnikovii]|uniref:hypothetical protein n=1 Tax=Ectothiorhodospira shaposhnikovii TaxID=1054 RepID=UPI001A910B52
DFAESLYADGEIELGSHGRNSAPGGSLSGQNTTKPGLALRERPLVASAKTFPPLGGDKRNYEPFLTFDAKQLHLYWRYGMLSPSPSIGAQG